MTQPTGSIELLTSAINNLASALLARTDTTDTSGTTTGTTKPDVTVKTTPTDTDTGTDTGTTTGTTTKKTGSSKKSSAKKTEDAAPPAAVRSKQEVMDAVIAYKDALGAPAARDLLKKYGFEKLAVITEDKYDVLYDDATDALADLPQDDDQEPEDEI